jgi:adhesin HecA-like repeat protein
VWTAYEGVDCRARPKQPAATVDCDFFEGWGSKSAAASVDPALKPIEKKLTKLPWNTWKVLAHGSAKLTKLTPDTLPIKSGKASVTLLNIVGKQQVQLDVQIDNAAGKRTTNTKVLVSAADYVMLVDEAPSNEAHMLALTCK